MSETIKTKQSILPSVAFAYLNGLYSNAADLLQDAEYFRAFKALEKRVCELLDDGIETDIIDSYVVYEHEPPQTCPTTGVNELRNCCDVATTGASDVR